MNVEWLIIGGGIHGVHIATRLLGEVGVEPEMLRIVDPCEKLLERWRTCTELTGMTHLRSPAVHHLDINAWSLRRYIRSQEHTSLEPFAPPYERPALELFNAHCDQVIREFSLDQLHIQARATSCTVDCDEVSVHLSTGEVLTAQHIVLAMGMGGSPEWPAWVPQDEPRVSHVFAPEFDQWPEAEEDVAVIGGGISAAQIALRLAKEGHRVHLVSRHDLREHQFDSDPGWLGPKYMEGFSQVRDADQRRVLINKARHKGSVSPDIRRALQRAIDQRQIAWHKGHVESCDQRDEALTLTLSTDDSFSAQRVLLATGFASQRPGGMMIDQLVESAELPCARCGYPIVDEALRWHPRIYVTGPLAELEIGPVSRNIAGARRAGDRLVKACLAEGTQGTQRPSRYHVS